jgi:peptide/nickel transport system substrate-binding protein
MIRAVLATQRTTDSKGMSMNKHRMMGAVAAAAALSLALAACGGNDNGGGGGTSSGATVAYNDANTKVVNPSDKKGGTLKMGLTDDWDSIDPGNTYYAFSWNFARLYTRALTTWKSVPGKEGLTVMPDLASGLGEVSDGGKTITYHLRQGIKYEDGTPVSSKDVKYAIERSNYAKDVLPNGPSYFQQYLIDDTYPGPYKDKSPDKLGLKGITTPDDSTVVFHLKAPFADFDGLTTNPQTSPVPPAKDTGAKYFTHPLSTGPYKVDTYQPGKTFVLSKNTNWNPDGAQVKQLPDKIEVSLGLEANDLDNRLLAGTLDIDVAGVGVSSAAQSKVLNDPSKKKNSDNVLAGYLRYINMSPKVKPFDNIHCRMAVQYAMDKVALQTAYGGPIAGGDIATTILPPSISGYQKFDLYPNGADHHGDIAKAKSELEACGLPNGFSTNISARADRPKEIAAAQALQQALNKVGIKADIKQFPSGKYFTNFAGAPAYVHQHNLGLTFMAWAADWPTGFGFLQQIVDGRAIRPAGNSNLAEVNLPDVNALFDKAAANTDVNQRNQIYGQIDRRVMEDASMAPIIYAKNLFYRNPAVTNVYVNNGFSGQYDYGSMGKQ